jgi:hypothetical protein
MLIKVSDLKHFYQFHPKTFFDHDSLTNGVPEQRKQHTVDPPSPSEGHS